MGFAPLAASRKRGSVATNTRAIALTDVLRPGAPKRIVKVEQLPKEIRDRSWTRSILGGKCTVGDVASAAGVKLSDAENAMSDRRGHDATLEVSAQGDILYVFDRDFRSPQRQVDESKRGAAGRGAGKVGGYLLRIVRNHAPGVHRHRLHRDRGAPVQPRRTRPRREKGRRHGSSMFFGPRMYFSPFDMFWYWDPYYYERRSYYAAMEGAKDMDFLERSSRSSLATGIPTRISSASSGRWWGSASSATTGWSPPSSSRRFSTGTKTRSAPTTSPSSRR